MALRIVRRVLSPNARYDRSVGRSFASSGSEEATFSKPEPEVVNDGDVGKASGIPDKELRRKVIIYSPARSASQQGRANLGVWKFNFESTERWEEPLMGWTSSNDPYSYVGDAALDFDSKEAAIEFARTHGWEYAVREPHQQTLKPKAYADNFKWKGAPVTEDS